MSLLRAFGRLARRFRTGTLVVGLSVAGAMPAAMAHTTSENVDQVVASVQDTYRNVTSLQANFVQVSRSAAVSGESTQKGKVEFKRPRKMRWEFLQPSKSLFVTDGTTMWTWTQADNQVIVSTDLGSAGGGMTELFDDLGKMKERFDVELVDPPSGPDHKDYVLELTPKQDTSFKKLEVYISRKKYTLDKVVMTDALDNRVELTFKQVKLNPDLPDADFVFQIPDGAKVIQAGGN